MKRLKSFAIANVCAVLFCFHLLHHLFHRHCVVLLAICLAIVAAPALACGPGVSANFVSYADPGCGTVVAPSVVTYAQPLVVAQPFVSSYGFGGFGNNVVVVDHGHFFHRNNVVVSNGAAVNVNVRTGVFGRRNVNVRVR